MLQINKKQMVVFSRFLLEEFEEKTKLLLRKRYPIKTKDLSDELLNKVIRDGIKKAEKYNIIKKDDVMIYIQYMICVGEDFDRNPANSWASKTLRIRNLRGTEKVIRLTNVHPLSADTE